ncbi:hypothetical protein OC846_000354 [Tilletia horrida]|uniref:Cytochrome b561 domain-containing protein n=1 Tax=Tilletia horrida TaxID=155126 RepID=A0AAN6GUK0_9BASI|nr:hypothetical protein OC846_000354 [Tilletia horrida]
MKASFFLGLLALGALFIAVHGARFGDQVCRGSLCVSAVYDDQASSVEYVASFAGAVGWIGVGQGSRMAGANMMVGVGWPTSDGQVVLSQRTASGHVPPATDQLTAQAFQPDMASSTTNASITSLVWTFPVAADFATAQTRHIWAYSSISPDSDDPSASIPMHDRDGIFALDLTKALGGENSDPTVSSNASSTASAPIRDLSNNIVRLLFAHMIVMSVAWMGFVAAGILIGRFRYFYADSWLKIHRAVQLFGLVLIVIGFALGWQAVESQGATHFAASHNLYGLVMFILVIIQACWGQIGRLIYRAKGIRLQNYGHILLGVVLFFGMSLHQIRLGFQTWAWQAPTWVPDIFFPVWFAVILLAFLGGLVLLPKERRRAAEKAQLEEEKTEQI